MAVAKDRVAAARSRLAVADAQRQAQRLTQFSKTKMCKFELLGMCTKGTACPFAHGQGDIRPLPDLRKTKLCSMMRMGKCTKEDCTFAHSKEELRPVGPAFQKAKLNRFEPSRFEPSGVCSPGTPVNMQGCSLKYSADVPRHDNVEELGYEMPPGLEELYFSPGEDFSPIVKQRPSENFEPPLPLKLPVEAFAPWAAEADVPRRVTLKAKNIAGGPAAWAPTEPAYVPLPTMTQSEPTEDFWKVQSSWNSESTLSTLGDRPEPLAAFDSPFAEGATSASALPAAVQMPMPVYLDA